MENLPKTVKDARQAGFKVRVSHHRIPESLSYLAYLRSSSGMDITKYEGDILPYDFHPRGGKCVVSITKNEIESTGIAKCSIEDNYNRKRGVSTAFGRAMKKWVGNNLESNKNSEMHLFDQSDPFDMI